MSNETASYVAMPKLDFQLPASQRTMIETRQLGYNIRTVWQQCSKKLDARPGKGTPLFRSD